MFLTYKFVVDFVRKTKTIENISSVTLIDKRYEILKDEFKTSLKKDEKLFWWLLSDFNDKIVEQKIKYIFNFLLLEYSFGYTKKTHSRIFGNFKFILYIYFF